MILYSEISHYLHKSKVQLVIAPQRALAVKQETTVGYACWPNSYPRESNTTQWIGLETTKFWGIQESKFLLQRTAKSRTVISEESSTSEHPHEDSPACMKKCYRGRRRRRCIFWEMKGTQWTILKRSACLRCPLTLVLSLIPSRHLLSMKAVILATTIPYHEATHTKLSKFNGKIFCRF